jgi:DNA-binding CsgD family transcriptional regulator
MSIDVQDRSFPSDVSVLAPRTRIVIDIAHDLTRLAVEHVAAQAEFAVVNQAGPATVVLTDRAPRGLRGPVRAVVLIAAPVASACQQAVHALTEGHVDAVVSRDDIEQLPRILEAVEHGVATVPAQVLRLARQVHELNEREQAMLALVARGATNARLATTLCISHATVKRDLAALLVRFGVSCRTELSVHALRLGLLDIAAVAAPTVTRLPVVRDDVHLVPDPLPQAPAALPTHTTPSTAGPLEPAIVAPLMRHTPHVL